MRRRFINNKAASKPQYLYIESLEDGLTASFSGNNIEYSMDTTLWNLLLEGESTIAVNSGERIYFRGRGLIVSYGIGTFSISKACNIGGNVMSMLYGDDYAYVTKINYENAFTGLFSDCTNIRKVGIDLLPATTLAVNCYARMFDGCSSLTNAPKLPATTLAINCYGSMFSYCSSLTNAPKLPATTLVNGCYSGMFKGCRNINYIKMLATDISATNFLKSWVLGVSSTGTFVKSKNATWDTTPGALGYDGVPAGWTVVNDGEESGGGLIDNKARLVEKDLEWLINFDYPVNRDLIVTYSNGNQSIALKGTQKYSTGYLTFENISIAAIDPSSDDMYNYTF